MQNIEKYIRHFHTINKHRWYVMIECFKVGLLWQGLIHDLSKYSLEEFFSSAKYFQGKSSPTEAERIERGYSQAWLHHKGRNKHHFHYWIDIDRGQITPVEMPFEYVLEMACDFIGAGKAYANVSNDKDEPLKYWNNKIDKKYIHPQTVSDMKVLLTNYAETGRLLGKK